jgi:hypothetical protein
MTSPLAHNVIRRDAYVSLTGPYTLGADTQLISVPAGYALCGLDLGFTDMDTGTVPTLAFDIGTAQNGATLLSAVGTPGTAGVNVVERFTPVRYAANGFVWAQIAAEAVTPVNGTVIATAYTYQAASRANLRDRTLRKLRVLAAEESPSAADASVTVEALEALHARLTGQDLTSWADAGVSDAATEDEALIAFGLVEWDLDSVPVFAAQLYAIMAASDLADTFGLPDGFTGRLLQEAAGAERELRRMTRIPTNGQPVRAEFF